MIQLSALREREPYCVLGTRSPFSDKHDRMSDHSGTPSGVESIFHFTSSTMAASHSERYHAVTKHHYASAIWCFLDDVICFLALQLPLCSQLTFSLTIRRTAFSQTLSEKWGQGQ